MYNQIYVKDERPLHFEQDKPGDNWLIKESYWEERIIGKQKKEVDLKLRTIKTVLDTQNMNFSGVFWLKSDVDRYAVGENLSSQSNQKNQFIYRFPNLKADQSEIKLLYSVSII